MIDLDLVTRVAEHFRTLMIEKGCEVNIYSDFTALKRHANSFDHDVSPHFDPDYNTFFRDEAFWIGIFKEDVCVGYCACKRMPVGHEGLIEYNRKYWPRVYGYKSETPVEFDLWQMDCLNIKGNLAYSGAWFVNPDYLKLGIGKALGHYAICLSFLQWRDTDYFYIFMDNKDVVTGLAAALELNEVYPRALQWKSHPSQAKEDYWMLGKSAAQFHDWAMAYLRKLERS